MINRRLLLLDTIIICCQKHGRLQDIPKGLGAKMYNIIIILAYYQSTVSLSGEGAPENFDK